MYTFTIRLADINIQVNTKYESISKRMKDYIINDNNIAFSIEVNDKKRNETKESLIRFNEGYSFDDDYVEYISIHSLIADELLNYDILLMHGSCLSIDGKGIIFTAASGTGKSTHSRLYRQAYGDRVKMINDDKPLLICKEDEIIACGSPWCGKHNLGCNEKVKLEAVVYLERGIDNSIELVNPSDVFEKLFIQTYHSKNKLNEIKAFNLLSKICKNTKMFKLKCNMNDDAPIISYNGIKNELL